MGAIGIDFGNYSYTVAGVRRGGAQVLGNVLNNPETPSLVVFGEARRYVGEDAASQRLRAAGATAADIKMLLGQRVDHVLRGSDAWKTYNLHSTSTESAAYDCAQGRGRSSSSWQPLRASLIV